MTKILTNAYTNFRLRMFYILVSACLFAILMYGINIYRVISDTVALQQTEREAASLSSVVQELDARFLKLSGELTPDRIQQFGLHEGQVSLYISRSTPLSRVALRAHEL